MILDATQYPQARSNSTTYADLLGSTMGLDRLPGERSDQYLTRLMAAAQLDRKASYQGLLNELTLQLGMLPEVSMLVSDTTGIFTASSDLAGIHLRNAEEKLDVSLVTFDVDHFWNWRTIAEITELISASRTFTAQLLGNGFAWQIAAQSNQMFVPSELISGQSVELAHKGVIQGSESFSLPVLDYTFGADGRTLHFAAPPPANLQVAYRHQVCPWSVVTSSVGVISLTDPLLSTVAIAPSGSLAYQVREYLHAITSADRSYFAR